MIAALFVNRHFILAMMIAGVIFGGAWYVAGLRQSNQDLSKMIKSAAQRADAAEAAVEKARRQAAEMIAARDEAHADYVDALQRIEAAEDQCLKVTLPASLLDQ